MNFRVKKNTVKYFLYILLQFSATGLFAQSQTMILSYEDFVQLRQKEAPSKGYLNISDISGSPYLNRAFRKGSVLTNQKIKYVNIPLRYNIFSDAMEFKDAKGEPMEIKFPEDIREISIGDTVFVYHSYFADHKIRKGYFQLLNRGKAQGLLRYRVEFQKAQPAGAYKEPMPPRFVPAPLLLYVSIDGQPAVEIHKTKVLMALLGDHPKELQAYIKKHKIKLHRAKDLKKLLEYYNTLTK